MRDRACGCTGSRGLGIDERTVLIVGEGGLRVEGAGNVWRALPADGGVLVSTMSAPASV